MALALAAASAAVVLAQERDRAKIPDAYKWNLTDLYPTDEAWRSAKTQLASDVGKAAAFKGTLGQSPARLQEAMDLQYGQQKTFARLAAYAGLRSGQAQLEAGARESVELLRPLPQQAAVQRARLAAGDEPGDVVEHPGIGQPDLRDARPQGGQGRDRAVHPRLHLGVDGGRIV